MAIQTESINILKKYLVIPLHHEYSLQRLNNNSTVIVLKISDALEAECSITYISMTVDTVVVIHSATSMPQNH